MTSEEKIFALVLTFLSAKDINKYTQKKFPTWGVFKINNFEKNMSKIGKFFKGIPTFFSEVRKEMKKVTWLTRKETLNKTLIVIGMSIILAIFLGGLDALFTWIVRAVIIKQ